MAKIKHAPNDPDWWFCECGNEPWHDGFIECDRNGNEVEPVAGGTWEALYICNRCGLIIEQSTGEIIGRGVPPWKVDAAAGGTGRLM